MNISNCSCCASVITFRLTEHESWSTLVHRRWGKIGDWLYVGRPACFRSCRWGQTCNAGSQGRRAISSHYAISLSSVCPEPKNQEKVKQKCCCNISSFNLDSHTITRGTLKCIRLPAAKKKKKESRGLLSQTNLFEAINL